MKTVKHDFDSQHTYDLFQQHIKQLISEVETAREKIVMDLIEKIEGRPAVILDALNLVIEQQLFDGIKLRYGITYKDVKYGYIEVDFSGKVELVPWMPNVEDRKTHALSTTKNP